MGVNSPVLVAFTNTCHCGDSQRKILYFDVTYGLPKFKSAHAVQTLFIKKKP